MGFGLGEMNKKRKERLVQIIGSKAFFSVIYSIIAMALVLYLYSSG